jgi:hypothetical protein
LFSAKLLFSVKWTFGRMAFGLTAIRSNVLSVKCHSVKRCSVKWYFGQIWRFFGKVIQREPSVLRCADSLAALTFLKVKIDHTSNITFILLKSHQLLFHILLHRLPHFLRWGKPNGAPKKAHFCINLVWNWKIHRFQNVFRFYYYNINQGTI